MLRLTIILLVFSVYTGVVVGEDGPIVELPQGKVVGTYMKSYYGREFSAFQGIPYAKPPVGQLRFEEPQPADPWTDSLYANISYMCLSFLPIPGMSGAKGTEDCLYVQVYVPRQNIDPNENLDVIVHIHGGAFMMGSPKMMAGPDFIMDKDVVYVSLNYRLGILGFLSTGDDVVPGNNGLKDQTMALKWIKDNIKHFGGNPDSITITGLSAGGASVHYHYLSPLSRGLFNRGYSQSGTALQSWALTKNALENARTVAGHLGCTTDSTKDMVACLKELPGKKLVKGITKCFVLMNAVPFTPFGPVIENQTSSSAFLPEHPYKLLKEGKVYDVPWVASNVKNEGYIPVGFFILLDKLDELERRWDEIMPYALDIMNTVDQDLRGEVLAKFKQFYLKDQPVSKNTVDDLAKLFTDRTYFMDTDKAIRIHSKAVKSPVYYYFFTYVLEQPSMFRGMRPGVAHSDDGKLTFKIILTAKQLPSNDEKIMNYLQEFLTTYAAKGVPKFKDVEWTPLNPNSDEINYLYIGGPDEVRMETMKELVPREFYDSLPIKENDKLF